MTLFTIDQEGRFVEIDEPSSNSDSPKADLLALIEKNPGSVVNRDVLVVGREINIDNEGMIHLLATDENTRLYLFDIRQKKITLDMVANVLGKASFLNEVVVKDLESFWSKSTGTEDLTFSDAFQQKFDKTPQPRANQVSLVLIAEEIPDDVARVSKFLRKNGLDISCVSMKFFLDEEGSKMVSREFVVGNEPLPVRPAMDDSLVAAPKTAKEKFFFALDNPGKIIFTKLLDFANQNGLEFQWTSKGFSLNVMVNNEPVGICFGYTKDSLLSECVYTSFDQINKKVDKAEEVVALYENRVIENDLFSKKRSGYRWEITDDYADEEVNAFLNTLKEVTSLIQENGLIGIEADAPVL